MEEKQTTIEPEDNTKYEVERLYSGKKNIVEVISDIVISTIN